MGRCIECGSDRDHVCDACHATAVNDAEADAERETLARVVKWLRAEAAKHDAPMPGVDPVGSVLVIADAIERGDWRER